MRLTRQGTFKRTGGFVGVKVDDAFTYSEVAEAAAAAHSLEPPSHEFYQLRLFRCSGSLILPDTEFSTQYGSQAWTWKAYQSSLSKYGSQLKFGIGYVLDVSLFSSYKHACI